MLGDDAAFHQVDESELLRLMTSDEELCDDELHGWFRTQCKGECWLGVTTESERLLEAMAKMIEVVVPNDYVIDALISAVAAESYYRGIRRSAKYLGVNPDDLEAGIESKQPPLSGIVIPTFPDDDSNR